MKKLSLIIFLSSSVLCGKEIYFADAEGVILSETVDPKVKLWFLKDYVFRREEVGLRNYGLGVKTQHGFKRPELSRSVGSYGETPDGPMTFYIVPIDEKTGAVTGLEHVDLAYQGKHVEKEGASTPPIPTIPAATIPPVASPNISATPSASSSSATPSPNPSTTKSTVSTPSAT